MNLTSCGNCGIVLDKECLVFPDLEYNDYSLIEDIHVVWDGEDYVSSAACPVCVNRIPE